ncbi:Ankyrin repeat [Legionella maceachernii]|nr:ankyrin repeat domain-containing protein [Legionella maceachernii]SUO99543.1 Ankyrin repeat [Legionella maceachernii]
MANLPFSASKELYTEICKDSPDIEKINQSIAKGADLNYQSEKDGYTPLMLAVKKQDIPLITFLLQQGADPFLKNDLDQTASDLAEENPPIYKLIKNYELLLATQREDSEKVKDALAKGAEINFQGKGGYTAIMIAVKNNSLQMVELLITYKPNFYRKTDEGDTVYSLAWDRLIRKTLQMGKPLTPQEKDDFFKAINAPRDDDEERYERGRLKMLEERKKHPFSLDQLQFRYFKSPATEEEIDALQDYIGHPLPKLYKEICRRFNGGKPKINYFNDIDGDVDQIGYFEQVTKKGEEGYTIWNVMKNFSAALKRDELPFASDSLTQSIFYLKWVGENVQVWRLFYGALAYAVDPYDDDDEDDDNYKPKYVHVLINESFEAFLETLYAVEE